MLVENISFMQVPVEAICFYPQHYFYLFEWTTTIIIFFIGLYLGKFWGKKKN